MDIELTLGVFYKSRPQVRQHLLEYLLLFDGRIQDRLDLDVAAHDLLVEVVVFEQDLLDGLLQPRVEVLGLCILVFLLVLMFRLLEARLDITVDAELRQVDQIAEYLLVEVFKNIDNVSELKTADLLFKL